MPHLPNKLREVMMPPATWTIESTNPLEDLRTVSEWMTTQTGITYTTTSTISNKDRLQLYEQVASNAVTHAKIAANTLGIAIHQIIANKLYLEHKDENGIPLYPTQEDYIPIFIHEIGISRATFFNYYMPVKITQALGLSYTDYEDTGGYAFWSKARRYIKYNSKTDEVAVNKMLAHGVDIKEYILEQVRELTADGPPELKLTQADLQKELKERLGDAPSIVYWYEDYEEQSIIHYQMVGKDYTEMGEFSATNVSEEVIQDLLYRLHISDNR